MAYTVMIPYSAAYTILPAALGNEVNGTGTAMSLHAVNQFLSRCTVTDHELLHGGNLLLGDLAI